MEVPMTRFLSGLALVAVAMPGAAMADGCASREKLMSMLAERHGEAPIATGLTSEGFLLEVTVSPAGTWTIVMTDPGGRACGVAAGEAWNQRPLAALLGPEA
jgi:hypothetical protein